MKEYFHLLFLEGMGPATASGYSVSVFRVNDKGMPSIHGHGQGDLHVQVNVKVPKKLDSKQKELLREFAKASGEKPAKENENGLFETF